MEEMVNSKKHCSFYSGEKSTLSAQTTKTFKELLKKSMVHAFTLLDIMTMEP